MRDGINILANQECTKYFDIILSTFLVMHYLEEIFVIVHVFIKLMATLRLSLFLCTYLIIS